MKLYKYKKQQPEAAQYDKAKQVIEIEETRIVDETTIDAIKSSIEGLENAIKAKKEELKEVEKLVQPVKERPELPNGDVIEKAKEAKKEKEIIN